MLPDVHNIQEVLLRHAEASEKLHLTNASIYFDNPTGIGEHNDILEACQAELDKAAVHRDRKELLLTMIHGEEK
jgi:hypothetical protein